MTSFITRSLAVAVALTAAATLGAQDRATDALLRVARWRFEADFKADKVALDSLLADDLTYGRSSGLRHSKSEVLALVGAGGPYALDYSTPDSLAARVYGESGVVTGLLKVKLTAQAAPYTLRFTDTWVRRNGRWQLVAFQATRLP
jgi:Domain of unknown function (DUF4440)